MGSISDVLGNTQKLDMNVYGDVSPDDHPQRFNGNGNKQINDKNIKAQGSPIVDPTFQRKKKKKVKSPKGSSNAGDRLETQAEKDSSSTNANTETESKKDQDVSGSGGTGEAANNNPPTPSLDEILGTKPGTVVAPATNPDNPPLLSGPGAGPGEGTPFGSDGTSGTGPYATGYVSTYEDAKKAAEDYVGRTLTDKDMQDLRRLTSAEAGSNQTEIGMVEASILNRLRDAGPNATVEDIAKAPGQFESVGRANALNREPDANRNAQIYGALQYIVPYISKDQKNFASANPGAYRQGYDFGQRYINERLNKGWARVGGSIFNTQPPSVSTQDLGQFPNGSPDGLTAKGGPGGQAFGGGAANPGVYALGHYIQDNIPGFDRFTAFNDNYHAGTNSFHAKGLALDFTITNPGNSTNVVGQLNQFLRSNGFQVPNEVYINNEYTNRSERWTGGHIHIEFRSQAAADRMLRIVGK